MNRDRRLLLRASAAGALIGAGEVRAASDAASPEQADRESALYRSVLDTLVPAIGDSPGALAIGLGDVPLTDPGTGNPADRHMARVVFAAQRVAGSWHGEPFATLDLERREAILLAILGPWPEGRQRPAEVEVAHRRSLQFVRKVVLDRFYTHPEGQASIGYHAPWPGGYRVQDIG